VIRADTFEAFEAAARTQGFDEVLVREWKPGQVVDTHTHPFAIDALVVRGEFRLRCGDGERVLKAGEGFELAREVPHAEFYGPQGATFWVARRH
jgi:quercetin dioxygenase-like cupin family protein